MKSIHYGGETLLTGDALADAVVHYAEALARGNTSSTVVIPVRLPDGSVENADVLLGPASQLVSVPEQSDFDEIVDDELVRRLDHKAALLGDPRPQAENEAPDDRTFDDLDYA